MSWVEDALARRTTYQYSWGRVSQVQTANTTTIIGVNSDGTIASSSIGTLTTLYEYDAAFRLRTVKPPGWNSTPVKPNPISYDFDDDVGRDMFVRRDNVSTLAKVDGFGRVYFTQDPANVKMRAEYDACGRQTFASAPYTAGGGTRGVTTQFDGLNRPTTATHTDGTVTTFTYAPTGVTVTEMVTDSITRTTNYEYQDFGGPAGERLIKVTDADNQQTTYRYDGLNNLTHATVPGVPTRLWEYTNGRLTRETHPESGMTTYTYFANGMLQTRTNAANETTTYTYDGDNRVTGIDGPGTSEDITIVYDPVHPRIGSQSMLNGTLSTTFGYDASTGRLQSRTDVFGTSTFSSMYGYNANDQLTSLTYPSGRVVTYEYDATQRLSVVKQNGATFASGFTYGDTGALASYVTGAVTHTVTLDNRDRIQRLTALGAGNAGLDLTYTYNRASQVTQITDPRPGATQVFSYDLLDRIKTAMGPWGIQTWNYDAAGNRMTEQHGPGITTYTYNASTQRLSSLSGATSESFTYDNAGRLTADSRGTYTYAPRGQLASVTSPSVTASYTYAPDATRLVRTVNNVTTYTTHSAGGQVLSEYQNSCGTTVWTRDSIYAAGRLIGAVRANLTQPTVAMAAASGSVSESQSSYTVNVQLTTGTPGPTTCPVTVSYNAAVGTATSGDFSLASGAVTFPSGSASGSTQPITLGVVTDALDEDDETLTVNLSTAEGATLGNGTTTVTIQDDDPLPALTVADAGILEGANGSTLLVLTVSLAPASGRTVTVNYATGNGSASTPSDYTAASGMLTFDAGATTRTITLTIAGDTVAEPDETVTVTLSNPTNATLARAVGTATIRDDDYAQRLIVGQGPMSGNPGWLATRAGATSFTHVSWRPIDWPSYMIANGEMHPASGNLDADVEHETVVGFGTGGLGWMAVLDDAARDYALLGWVQVPWTSYNDANGTVYPAIGDLDGDGRGEIVAGFGPGGGGWFAVFEGVGTPAFAFRSWGRVDWPNYYNGTISSSTGETHPAVANVDGVGGSEILIGLGPGGDGYVEVLEGTGTYAHRSWIQVHWTNYNTTSGVTWPAAGDLDGDGKAEVVIGLGTGGGGWLQIFDDASTLYTHRRWLQVPWIEYNQPDGATRPAVGNLDGDALAEIAVGLGPAGAGWVALFDDDATGGAFLLWFQLDALHRNPTNGQTWPAIGRYIQ